MSSIFITVQTLHPHPFSAKYLLNFFTEFHFSLLLSVYEKFLVLYITERWYFIVYRLFSCINLISLSLSVFHSVIIEFLPVTSSFAYFLNSLLSQVLWKSCDGVHHGRWNLCKSSNLLSLPAFYSILLSIIHETSSLDDCCF